MAELMLVNPRRKRRKTAATRKRRSNPRRRRRTMTAAQAKYFAPRRRSRVRRNPRRKAASGVTHHRKRRSRRSVGAFARHTGGSLSLHSLTSGAVINNTVIPAALGAAGAVALDAIYGFLPIPTNLKGGTFAAPVKAAAVLGIGIAASNFLPKQRALINNSVAAALTIMAYNFIKAQVQTMLPNVPLGAYIDGVGYVNAAQFIPDQAMPGMGAYISGAGNQSVAWADAEGDIVF